MRAFLAALIFVTGVGGWFGGYNYATRHNDILVMFAESDKANTKALENFQRVLEETDFCESGRALLDGGENGE